MSMTPSTKSHRYTENRIGIGLTSPRLWMTATIATFGGLLGTTFVGVFAQDAQTQGVYPAIAGVSALYFLAAFGLPWAINRPSLGIRRWVPWGAAGLTLIAVLGAIALWWLNRWGLGYQWIQTLKVVTGPYGWGDLKLYFDWLSCSQQGINPISAPPGACMDEPMNYGPGFLWWTPLAILRPAMDLIGVITAVVCALAIAWLARRSAPRGALVLLLAALSPAWITLIERGNFDILIIWVAIAIVFLSHRFSGLWPWIVGAILIFILGTWKYYPFAMVLTLIPVLAFRRGLWVVTGLMTAALIYIGYYWNVALGDMETHTGLSGGIGRTTLAAFFAGEAEPDPNFGWADGAVLALIAFSALWGASLATQLGDRRVAHLERPAMLAVAGSVTIIGSVVLAGSGFIYKSALLLLTVPLLAALTRSGSGVMWRSGLTYLGIVLVAVFVEWNLLASSAALQLAAGFTFGLSIVVLVRRLIGIRSRHVDSHTATT